MTCVAIWVSRGENDRYARQVRSSAGIAVFDRLSGTTELRDRLRSLGLPEADVQAAVRAQMEARRLADFSDREFEEEERRAMKQEYAQQAAIMLGGRSAVTGY